MPEASAIREWLVEHRADLGPFLDVVKEEIEKEGSDHD